jgi:hypothetical protein
MLNSSDSRGAKQSGRICNIEGAPMGMWLAVGWLASFAAFLEAVDRAPEIMDGYDF